MISRTSHALWGTNEWGTGVSAAIWFPPEMFTGNCSVKSAPIRTRRTEMRADDLAPWLSSVERLPVAQQCARRRLESGEREGTGKASFPSHRNRFPLLGGERKVWDSNRISAGCPLPHFIMFGKGNMFSQLEIHLCDSSRHAVQMGSELGLCGHRTVFELQWLPPREVGLLHKQGQQHLHFNLLTSNLRAGLNILQMKIQRSPWPTCRYGVVLPGINWVQSPLVTNQWHDFGQVMGSLRESPAPEDLYKNDPGKQMWKLCIVPETARNAVKTACSFAPRKYRWG